jgi:hypothetical protein
MINPSPPVIGIVVILGITTTVPIIRVTILGNRHCIPGDVKHIYRLTFNARVTEISTAILTPSLMTSNSEFSKKLNTLQHPESHEKQYAHPDLLCNQWPIL